MNLTGTTFQVVIVVAAVVASLAALLLWNRVGGPRPVRLLGRAGLLAAGYLLAAAAVLVSINNAYGGLIATWGDLFDNLHTQHRHGHHRWSNGRPPWGPGQRPGRLPGLTPSPPHHR